MSPVLGTTTPTPDPQTPAFEAKALALVLLYSAAEPHRSGEAGFFIPFTKMLIGRGVVGLANFLQFGQHRPGAAPVIEPRDWALLDSSISREQLIAEWKGDVIEITVQGSCPTYVNDVRIPQGQSTTIKENDILRLWDCAVFLVVRRQRVMPALCHLTELPPFGKAGAMKTVGESPEVWLLRDAIAAAAARHVHVLILGESGSGKEAVAHAIHDLSDRAKKVFNGVNAAGITESIFISEVFGNLANYLYAGMQAREGLLPDVEDGTAFLDEVGGLSHEYQTKLCRPMESGEYHKIGEARVRRLLARIIAATSSPKNVFKKDFLNRFELTIELPALNTRREDIPLLIMHFVMLEVAGRPEMARFLERAPDGQMYPRLDAELVALLVRHPLTGSVREVKNLVGVAIHESKGNRIEVPMLLRAMAKEIWAAKGPVSAKVEEGVPSSGAEPSGRRAKCTKAEMVAALEQAGGSVQGASKVLGVPRRTVRTWVEEYGLRGKEE